MYGQVLFKIMLLSVVKRVHSIKRICQSIYQRVKSLKDVLDEKTTRVCHALPLSCIHLLLDTVKQIV